MNTPLLTHCDLKAPAHLLRPLTSAVFTTIPSILSLAFFMEGKGVLALDVLLSITLVPHSGIFFSKVWFLAYLDFTWSWGKYAFSSHGLTLHVAQQLQQAQNIKSLQHEPPGPSRGGQMLKRCEWLQWAPRRKIKREQGAGETPAESCPLGCSRKPMT